VDQIKDHGVVERSPLLEGKSMHITVASIHKPKTIEHVSKHAAATEAEAEAEIGTEPASETAAEVSVSEAPPVTAREPVTAAPAKADAVQDANPAPAEKAIVAPKKAIVAPKRAVAAKRKATTDGATATAPAPKPAPGPTRMRTVKAEPEAPAAAPAGE
jgi:hypothetical protein